MCTTSWLTSADGNRLLCHRHELLRRRLAVTAPRVGIFYSPRPPCHGLAGGSGISLPRLRAPARSRSG